MSETTLEPLEPVIAPSPVSPGVVDRMIGSEEYHLFAGNLTVCALTMRNGFIIVGKSAPAPGGRFDELLGRVLARADAVRQASILEGYRRMAGAT